MAQERSLLAGKLFSQGNSEQMGGEGLAGKRTAADSRLARNDGARYACFAKMGGPRPGSLLDGLPGHGDHVPDGDFALGFAFEVMQKSCFQGGKRDLVYPERPGEEDAS